MGRPMSDAGRLQASMMDDESSKLYWNKNTMVFFRFPKILKGLIAMMIYVTHALNFWVPFNLVFFYLKSLHKPGDEFKWEMVYRAAIVTIIGIVAIVFPSINALMGFVSIHLNSQTLFKSHR